MIIDEVLAVGDAEFQKKAVGKLEQVSKGQGRTVLFVSHNMTSVNSLCSRGILLDNGRVTFQGKVDEVVDAYLQSAETPSVYIPKTLKIDNPLWFEKIEILDESSNEKAIFSIREKSSFIFNFQFAKRHILIPFSS